MSAGKDIGITIKKKENFSEWYTQVVLKAELADYARVKGFMVCMPNGYAIWEKIQDYFNARIKALGHRNAYFPALIPESLLRKEAEHFKGFTPEVFWVSEAGDNKLAERLAVRPTSETIIYDSYSKWVKSYRDLPLLLNVWNSVLRAEITATRPFLRTSEFLWQEGHTVHASKEDADKEVLQMLEIYRDMVEGCLAIPVIAGTKSDSEKFVGALYTTTLEALMPDGKALQMGTSHNLGQHFSIPFEIKYLGPDEKEHFAWTTSWGVSWRIIGATIMTHSDDKGLVVPPNIAPIQIVIIPIFYKENDKQRILRCADEIKKRLETRGLSVMLDSREQYTPGWKYNEWELKGVPLRIEIGPRDMEKNQVTTVRRDNGEKLTVAVSELETRVNEVLQAIQKTLYNKAKKFLEENIRAVETFDELRQTIDTVGGFVRACWCSSDDCEAKIKEETGATIRAIPFEPEKIFSSCVYCGKDAKNVVYLARSY